MKRIICSITIYICVFLWPSISYALDEKLSVNLFINDEATMFSVYNNFDAYEGHYLSAFIPLMDVLNALKLDISEDADGLTIINEKDRIFIKIKFLDSEFHCEKYPSSDFKQSYNFSYGTYLIIEGVHYIELKKFATILDGQAVQRGSNIYLYTEKYYYDYVAISDRIGHLVNINVYINNIPAETLVYRNIAPPYSIGSDNMNDYVQLEPIFDVLETVLSLELQNQLLHNAEIVYINDEKYIPFSTIRYLIDGSLRQNDPFSMYLYSSNFVRTDIPATLQECYAALDNLLDEATKNDIKQISRNELVKYHFGLGMWVRNNWIYPSPDRVAKEFLDMEINHPDDISSMILEGYQNYLKGLPYQIRPPKSAFSRFAIGIVIFAIILSVIVWRKRKIKS